MGATGARAGRRSHRRQPPLPGNTQSARRAGGPLAHPLPAAVVPAAVVAGAASGGLSEMWNGRGRGVQSRRPPGGEGGGERPRAACAHARVTVDSGGRGGVPRHGRRGGASDEDGWRDGHGHECGSGARRGGGKGLGGSEGRARGVNTPLRRPRWWCVGGRRGVSRAGCTPRETLGA